MPARLEHLCGTVTPEHLRWQNSYVCLEEHRFVIERDYFQRVSEGLYVRSGQGVVHFVLPSRWCDQMHFLRCKNVCLVDLQLRSEKSRQQWPVVWRKSKSTVL